MTDEQIVEVVRESLGKHAQGYDQIEISIVRREGNDFTIRLERMYEYVPVDFETMNLLSKRFNTKLIDISNKHFMGGCETCDYGSSYVINLSVKNASLEPAEAVCEDKTCEYCGGLRSR